MKAFHNDPEIKSKYLNRVIAHRNADEILQGKYWEKGKGCAVGCTIHGEDHSAYERELGIPTWLAKLEDRLFEGLNLTEAKTFPERFLSAIPVGCDLESIKGPFLIFVLESTLDKFDHNKFPKVKICVDQSLALWRRTDIGSKEWVAAAAAASYAAAAAAAIYAAAIDAADDTAYAAAVYAASYAAAAVGAASYAAADTAYSAAYVIDNDTAYAAYASYAAAAIDAAGAAEMAAGAVGRKVEQYEKIADKLIELMKTCK